MRCEKCSPWQINIGCALKKRLFEYIFKIFHVKKLTISLGNKKLLMKIPMKKNASKTS